MAIREILEVPDPRLKMVSVPLEAEEFNDDLKTLVEDMFDTMYDAPGIGLAAIQVEEAAAPSVEVAVDGADDAVRSPTPSPGQLSPGRLLQALLECCSDAPGAVEAEAAGLSAEQREARQLLAQAEAAEAEADPTRAATLYRRAFKLDPELDQSPTSAGWGGSSHPQMFVSRFLSAVRGAPYDTEDPYGFI